MNIKIENCLRDCHDMDLKILEATAIEQEVENSTDEHSKQKKLQTLKLLKSDIRFLHENIIRSLPYAKIVDKEDVEGIKKCVEKIMTAKYCTLKDEDKSFIIKTLSQITDKEQAKEISKFTTGLIEKDTSFITDLSGSVDMVVEALREASQSGKENATTENIFGQYYNLRNFLVANQQEFDFGKNVVKTICQDDQIDKKYKDAVKKGYQDFKIQVKHHGIDKRGYAALGGALLIGLPFGLVSLAADIGLGIVKKTGEVLNIATDFLALPFDYLGAKILEKSDSPAAKVGAVIADLPGIVLKSAGLVVNGILKIGTFVAGTALSVAFLPAELAMKGILKAGHFNVEDRIKQNDKKIAKVISELLSDKENKVKPKEIMLDSFEFSDKAVTIIGTYGEEEKPFDFTFQISKDVLENIAIVRKSQMLLTEEFFKASIAASLTGDPQAKQIAEQLDQERQNLVYQESLIISNIISNQKTIERPLDAQIIDVDKKDIEEVDDTEEIEFKKDEDDDENEETK